MKNNQIIVNPQFLFPLLLICYLWTFLQGWIPKWGATWVFSVFGAIIGLRYTLNTFYRNGLFFTFIIFLITVIFNAFVLDPYWTPIRVIREISVLIWAPSMFFYVINNNEYKLLNSIVNTCITIIILTTICSSIINAIYPNAIRIAADILNQEHDITLTKQFFRWGGSNYFLPHAIPIIIPAIILGIKNPQIRVKQKYYLFVFLFLCFSLVWLSGAFTALLLSVFAIICSSIIGLGQLKANLVRIVIIGLIVFPFMNNSDLLMRLLSSIEDFIGENNFFTRKIIDFQNSLDSGEVEGDAGYRIELYLQSFSQGINNLLFGTNDVIGGHSTIVDHFASLGLIGFIPFLLFIFRSVKFVCRLVPQYVLSFYLLGIVIGLMMLLLKNMSCGEVWIFLFTLLPLMILKYSPNINSLK